MLRRLIRWAIITAAGDDTGQFAVQQMKYNGKVADGMIVFPYGIHGNVPPGAQALMFAVQGNPENRAAIAWTPKDRPELKEGEVAFYHPPTDAFIIWRSSGALDIETGAGGSQPINIKCTQANIQATESATIDTPLTTLTGAVQIDGTLNVAGQTALKGVTSNTKNIGSTHVHPQGSDSDGDTQQNTGAPQ